MAADITLHILPVLPVLQLPMTAQLTGKSEHLRAARHYTAVGPRPGVNIFVDVEISREAGTKTAGVAHKRLLAGVGACVDAQLLPR